jgi:flagellar basal body rod protein FlgB
MPSPTSVIDQIAAAMSVTNLRHEVITSNIANRDTQGYQRLKVEFQRVLGELPAATVRADTSGVTPALDQEVVALSSNSGHYQALARVLSRYLSIISTIASPNRG